jgi:hypothetical protein
MTQAISAQQQGIFVADEWACVYTYNAIKLIEVTGDNCQIK